MENKNFIKEINLQNFLSFGTNSTPFELKPLNVLIGTNGSGKSNFIEALSLLKSSTTDIRNIFRTGGGVLDYIYKGSNYEKAEIDVKFNYPSHVYPLRYFLRFMMDHDQFIIDDEFIQDSEKINKRSEDVIFYYRWQNSAPSIRVFNTETNSFYLTKANSSNTNSILSQIKNDSLFPEISYISKNLSRIRIFNDLYTGKNSSIRTPQRADLINDFLIEDISNLPLILNSLIGYGLRDEIIHRLRLFNRSINDYYININFNALSLYLNEFVNNDIKKFPATRISDGTLRYLCLLSILLHPEPPALICIEEPEIGLHPDALFSLAELLIDASSRTQLIITTHSDILVSRLGALNHVESVVVCENNGYGTELKRLDEIELMDWIKDYKSLGDVWLNGSIGGVL